MVVVADGLWDENVEKKTKNNGFVMLERFVIIILLSFSWVGVGCGDGPAPKEAAPETTGPPVMRDGGTSAMPDAGSVAEPDSSEAFDSGTTTPECTSGPEDTAEMCSDGCSNDDDQFIDCDDRDCCGVVSGCPASTFCGMEDECTAGAENTAEMCSDGCSNDEDSFVDCDDFDCCGIVECPASTACGAAEDPDFVSVDATDCVGTGRVSSTFDGSEDDVRTIAISTSRGYQIFGYTRATISSGPFPLTGTSGERQIRVGDLGSGLKMVWSSWDGNMWSSIDGGDASFSESSIVVLASDAEALYSTHSCIGYLQGSATGRTLNGLDLLTFEFTAPVIGLGFPGVR